ncbi:hypothetical protein [Reyranella soli]|uniref:Uncharacterized protein n=1 Tax=Reyranella soli TaxID=1230389 RepID=A0A512NCS1_9HYPH|nr:hypothetical protein [Reyranella soli]GEP56714.1 hypothetical protein RSO01_38800 [Reyranella soli]
MDHGSIWILAGSTIALLGVFLIEFWVKPRRSESPATRSIGMRVSVLIAVALGLAVLVALAVLVRSSLPSAIEPKGVSETTSWGMVVVMYVAMVAGIVAQSYYFGDGAQVRWSWLKPALASPIIFIPLISSYQTSLST